jgi:hypothetical protein
MKIDPLSKQRLSPARRGERTKSSESGGFARELGGETPAGGPVSGAAGLGSVDALLALQEVPDSLTPDGKARRRAEALLDELDQLRLDLLTGALPQARLERLATLAAVQRERIDDPRLAQVIEEVELRAAVELAKLGH